MRNWKRRLSMTVAIAVSATLIALAGCAKQEPESAATPPPDSGTALQPAAPPLPAPQAEPSEPQHAQGAPATAKAPDDFPLPIHAGFQVKKTMRTTAGDFKGMQVEIVGNAPPQTVAEFYEAEFNKRGLKVSKMSQQTEEGEESLVLGQSETVTAGVAVAKQGNQTRAVLSWSEKANKTSP